MHRERGRERGGTQRKGHKEKENPCSQKACDKTTGRYIYMILMLETEIKIMSIVIFF